MVMKKKKTTICELVLRYISAAGPLYPHEIAQAAYEFSQRPGRAPRGWWSCQLYGTWAQHGLLRRFCTRLPNGQYTVTEEIKGPFLRGPKTRSQEQHIFSGQAREAFLEREAGDCPNCHQTMRHKEPSPDCLGHRTSWGAPGYMTDCLSRVWAHVHGDSYVLTDMTGAQLRKLEEMFRRGSMSSYNDETKAVSLAILARRV